MGDPVIVIEYETMKENIQFRNYKFSRTKVNNFKNFSLSASSGTSKQTASSLREKTLQYWPLEVTSLHCARPVIYPFQLQLVLFDVLFFSG